ncbi:PREDICTED: uncharacterized protein LOC104733194 [Camelina sativa]|uniref:ATP-dependent DNA helicase n=1 Tax=Camelina sativa TaxID=90675 RepID=A0ABM0V5I9_CAMSA|nr:PREDICTED: uncharacterized protein LOC104733194 [Camelina sativa]
MTGSGKGKPVDEEIVGILVAMLDNINELAKVFRKARDRYEDGDCSEFNIKLVNQAKRGKQFDLPTTDEIAGLIVGDFSTATSGRDVILQFKSSELQRISDLHPLYMSLQYPLLFPYGDAGYHEEIPYESSAESQVKRSYMTMREYYAYQIQTRLSEGMTIIKGGRLFHQYIVDAYTATEQERLRYIALNQKKLRADLYNNVYDAVERGETDAKRIGRRIILPSSFTAGPRYMVEKYHDAMAICRWFGNPDLFITFTANPNWPELTEHLQTYTTEGSNSRPDLQSRVFKKKLDEMLNDFNNGVFFPVPVAVVYTIEFQKRGLPHAHILLWLGGNMKNPEPAIIDSFISAELPDKEIDKEGFELVEQHMIHGPCGLDRPYSPCMENGICTKKYPRTFVDNTTIDKSGYVVYRRRNDDSKFVIKGLTRLDNRNVVPHNLNLLKKYMAHINVEWCCKTSAVKYLFKYITKGVDKATFVIVRPSKGKKKKGLNKEEAQPVDEISEYLDCRYVSACEAVWRIFAFHIHYHKPAVIRLHIHLQDQHRLLFDQLQRLESIISREDVEKTMLTEWMATNQREIDSPDVGYNSDIKAYDLTYMEFPKYYVWNTTKTWTRRKQGFAIGRIVHIHPSAGDLFYLRVLLNIVKGATCFDDIKTVAGVIYGSNKEACYIRGLLDDDKEWHDVLKEVAQWASAYQIRYLFVTLLLYCEVANPRELWNKNWKYLAEDVQHNRRKVFHFTHLNLNEEELEQYALIEIEELLMENDKSLTHFQDMPVPDKAILQKISQRCFTEDLQVDIDKEKIDHGRLFPTLNEDQRKIYDAVLNSVQDNAGRLFFLQGLGGTGKTYLYKTIIAKIRSISKIVIPVASAGIAALLLPGGRTAHSRFKIPINLHEGSTCDIKPGTMLATLITKAELIIWDEAPMAHKHAFEAVDRTIRDLMALDDETALNKPFGGKTVLLGGDFRQILPVVPQGSRQDTVQASLNRSHLWSACQIYKLTINMRLNKSDAAFAAWILKVGDGNSMSATTNPEDHSDGCRIAIEECLMLPPAGNQLEAISTAAYPGFCRSFKEANYLTERAILTPRNETVREINEYQLSKVAGDTKEYLSADSLQTEVAPGGDLSNLYTVEYLNSLEFPGLPNHQIRLKVGVPVMLLRNLNQKKGLCNGTRLIVTRLGLRIIEAEILTGTHVGERVLIPRIVLSPNDTKHPFTLRRKQFPIRVCYAMTINKSQGQSLKQVALYLPQSVFTHGQLYVALSHVTSNTGLKILDATAEKNGTGGVMNIVYKEVFNNINT